MNLTRVGRTVTVDASTSSDPDGSIVEYLWEFGDGTTATGPAATHTYTEAGRYLTTLAVRDDRGEWSVTVAEHVEDIPRYDFTGFFDPVQNLPATNAMNAGRAVPLKFSLGGDHGLGVLAENSPASARVDCVTGGLVTEVGQTFSAGQSQLQYDPVTSTYTYVWKTSKAWGGTCRELRLRLDDGSVHEALFRFRG